MCFNPHLMAEKFRKVHRSPHPANTSLGSQYLLLYPSVEGKELVWFEEIPCMLRSDLPGKELHESYLQLGQLAPRGGKLPLTVAVSGYFWGIT